MTLDSSWQLSFSDIAIKQLNKTTPEIKKKLVNYMETRIMQNGDPRAFGKPLSGKLAGLWRYRVDDYRIICEIKDNELIILVLRLGHRRDIYE